MVPSAEGPALLAREANAKDLVTDAFAHAKFIACCDAAKPLFSEAVSEDRWRFFSRLRGLRTRNPSSSPALSCASGDAKQRSTLRSSGSSLTWTAPDAPKDLVRFYTRRCSATPLPRSCSAHPLIRAGAELVQPLTFRRGGKVSYRSPEWSYSPQQPNGSRRPAHQVKRHPRAPGAHFGTRG